jgi:hypothetical protein
MTAEQKEMLYLLSDIFHCVFPMEDLKEKKKTIGKNII